MKALVKSRAEPGIWLEDVAHDLAEASRARACGLEEGHPITLSSRPTISNAATARSTCSVSCAAES